MRSPLTSDLWLQADVRKLQARLILDVADGYATDRGIAGGLVRPMHSLTCSFTAKRPAADGPTTPIDPRLVLKTNVNPSGYVLWFGGCKGTEPDPDPGTYELRIESDLYAPFTTEVAVPQPTSPVGCYLQPGPNYPFPGGGMLAANAAPTLLRGTVQDVDGRGLPDVDVTASSAAHPSGAATRTDRSGQFVLVIQQPAPKSVDVTLAYPQDRSRSVRYGEPVPITMGADNIIQQLTIAGRIIGGVRGSTVRVSRRGQTTLVVGISADGTWRATLPPERAAGEYSITAEEPNGRRARASVKALVTAGQGTAIAPDITLP